MKLNRPEKPNEEEPKYDPVLDLLKDIYEMTKITPVEKTHSHNELSLDCPFYHQSKSRDLPMEISTEKEQE